MQYTKAPGTSRPVYPPAAAWVASTNSGSLKPAHWMNVMRSDSVMVRAEVRNAVPGSISSQVIPGASSGTSPLFDAGASLPAVVLPVVVLSVVVLLVMAELLVGRPAVGQMSARCRASTAMKSGRRFSRMAAIPSCADGLAKP